MGGTFIDLKELQERAKNYVRQLNQPTQQLVQHYADHEAEENSDDCRVRLEMEFCTDSDVENNDKLSEPSDTDTERDEANANAESDGDDDDDDFISDGEEFVFPKCDDQDEGTCTHGDSTSCHCASEQHLKVKHKQLFKPQRTNSKKAIKETSNDAWEILPLGDRPGYASMCESGTGMTYTVPASRVIKARDLLSHDSVMKCLHPKSSGCHCGRQCWAQKHWTRWTVLEERKVIALLENDDAVGAHLTRVIRRDGGLKSRGETVCRGFYQKLHGVGDRTIRKAVTMAKIAGADAVWKRSTTKLPATTPEPGKKDHAYTFWSLFFDKMCQRPNDDIRLFPVNKTMDDIWREYFTPWWKWQEHPESQKPQKSTWQKQRYHPDFKDVQRRAKHFHLRCTTCATLKQMHLLAWTSGDAMHQYTQARRRHEAAIIAWRKLESHLDAESVQCPEELVYLSFDATAAMSTPRLQNRPIKAFSKGGMSYTPWLITNPGRKERDYIYLPQGKWDKGGNYVMTQVMAMIRRIKSDSTNPQHKARRLVMVADNASENKNNAFMALASDLVSKKWFDEVEIVFGEVGHTHNGNDATHKVHNQDLGNHESGDLGHLVWNYRFPWSNAKRRPRASILNVMFDWKSYYEPHMRALSGFSKTSCDELIVRGFKACRDSANLVQILWKVDPATDKYWRGEDGMNTPGFIVLKSIPVGAPPEIEATKVKASAYAHQLLKNGLAETLEPWISREMLASNLQTITTGIVEVSNFVEDVVPAGEWGRLCKIGAHPECKGEVRFISRDSVVTTDTAGQDSLWHLPADCLESTSLQFHVGQDEEALINRPLPNLRFSRDEEGRRLAANRSAVFKHPNNVAARNSQPLGLVPAANASDDEEEEGEWEGENWVADMANYKAGDFAVLLYETTDNPPQKFIEVAKIKKLHEALGKIVAIPLACTKNALSCACYDGVWNTKAGAKYGEVEAAVVICYMKAKDFKAKKVLTQDALEAIQKRKIFASPAASSSSSSSS